MLGDLDENARERYVERLLDGSASEYVSVLRALDMAPSWPVATQIIARDIIRRHQIVIANESALADFTDAVESQFKK